MKHVNRRSLILLSFLGLLLVQFGRWEGQANRTESTGEGGDNTTFLLLYVPALLATLYVSNRWGYWKVFRPVRKPLGLFLITIVGVGLFRGDFVSAARNMASIMLTYSIVLGLAAMSFSIPFRRAVDVFIFFIAGVFLPLTVYVHLTTVGPLVLFPDRMESNNLRLGGLVYYAHTAMLLGIGGLFALYQLLRSRTFGTRLYYGLLFVALNVFLLFTDCRSLWGGVAFAYGVLVLQSLPKAKRWPLVGAMAVVILLLYSGAFSVKQASQYQTGDDFTFRMVIWGLSLEGISQRPLTGYGTENYFSSNQKAMDFDQRLSDPHSALLSLALQSGLLVVFLFIRLYYQTVRQYTRYTTGPTKPLVAVAWFWLFAPFFWGLVYNGAAGFVQILFPLTYFVSLLHPELYQLAAVRPVRPAPARVSEFIPYAETVE